MKNFVMNAKIDPKVVTDLTLFSSVEWSGTFGSPAINICWIFFEWNELWLLIGNPSRDPFLVTQYLERHSVGSDQHVKKLMSFREGLHVMTQCNMRQHFADRYWLHEHPGGHASSRERTMRENSQKNQPLIS